MNTTSEKLSIFVPQMVVGGAQRSMLKLAVGMAARGYRVDLVAASATGELLSEIPKSVALVDLKASRAVACLPALTRYLHHERPCALLSVLHTNIIGIWAKYLSNVRTRVIVSERNTLSSEAEYYRSDLRFRLLPKLIRTFYPLADAIVAVSQGVADDLVRTARISPNKVHVIYNPIITPDFQQKMLESLDHPWLKKGEPPVILAVGRLTAQKDFSTLIRAFAQVCKTHLARLMILGEGEKRQTLESLIAQMGLAEQVSMPGYVPNPYPYMRRASAFVLSSRWEGLPGVLIEALYSGIPLISTDCPSGPYEILAGGQYGRLVPVGDVTALANAMELALDGKISPPVEESWHRFQLETVADQYIDLLFNES
jgi:glycosyltransferase involved in cell wall biosynthesis